MMNNLFDQMLFTNKLIYKKNKKNKKAHVVMAY